MKNNAMMIGVFILATCLLVVTSVIWLSGNELFDKQQKVNVYYEGNVSGLSVGAPVTFRGVSIGQVTAIDIQVDGHSLKTTIPVALKLQPEAFNLTGTTEGAFDIEGLVRRGLRARLASQSIVTGQKAIELDFVPGSPAVLHGREGEAEIPALADRFGGLIDQIAELPLRNTVQDMRKTMDELQQTLKSVRETLRSADGLLTTAATELKSTTTETRAALNNATSTIDQVGESSVRTLDSVTRLANSSNDMVVSTHPELQRTLAESRQAAQAARVAMEHFASVAAPGAPMRADLEGAVRDLSQSARDLRSLGEMLEERPNALIFGRKNQ